jgi:hypothetical protein
MGQRERLEQPAHYALFHGTLGGNRHMLPLTASTNAKNGAGWLYTIRARNKQFRHAGMRIILLDPLNSHQRSVPGGHIGDKYDSTVANFPHRITAIRQIGGGKFKFVSRFHFLAT